MKKFLVFLLAAGVMASCSNGGDGAKDVKDSLDSVTNLKKESVDEAAQAAKDTMEKTNDSLKNHVDSVAKQAKDSLNKSK